MKLIPLFILALASYLAFPSPAVSDYITYTQARTMNIRGISFQGIYAWYALADSEGAVREDTRDGSLKTFGVPEGLPDHTVNAVFADSKGMVWFGTDKGTSRYDGSSWTYYNIDTPYAAANTYDIKEDENGVLWFATQNGVRSFDGTKWGAFNTQLPGWITRHIAIGKNGVKWFGTEQGVTQFDGSNWTYPGSNEYVSALFEDSKGLLWILYHSGGTYLAVISDGIASRVPVNFGLSTDPASAIGETSAGTIWCGSGIEFHSFDGISWQTVPIASDSNINEAITCSAYDLNGSLWFGGYNNELYEIEKGTVTHNILGNGPIAQVMNDLAVDLKGIKWFGTNKGLSRFDGKRWKTYYERDGLAGNWVNVLAMSVPALWCGTNKGISRFDGVSWKNFGLADGLPDSWITSIAASRDGSTVWAGTSKGVSRYDGMSWKTFTKADGLPDSMVNKIFLDNMSGTVYAGTNHGAVKFDGSKWIPATPSPDSISAVLVDSKSRLWVGTNRGLLRFDGASWTLFNRGDGISNLQDNVVTALAEDSSGGIWAATSHGSVRFDGFTWTVDLRLDRANAIASDSNGDMWLLRGGLILRYTGPSGIPTGPLKGTWTLWSNRYGTGSFAFAGGAVWGANNGEGGGVVRINPSTHEIKVFTTADGLPANSVSPVLSGDGVTVWANASTSVPMGATTQWLIKWDGNAWQKGAPQYFSNPSFSKLFAADAEGGLWSFYQGIQSSFNSITRSDINGKPNSFRLYSGVFCQAIYISPRNTAWIADYGLLIVPYSAWYSGSNPSNLVNVTLPYPRKITIMVEDREGNLWCGGGSNAFGVARYDGANWKTFTIDDGLPSNNVNSLAAEPSGVIWAATNSGLARFDGKQWLAFNSNNSGLKDDYVRAVAVDPDSTIWFSGSYWIQSFVYGNSLSVAHSSSMPTPLSIDNVSPNPFNSSSLIRFFLPSSGKARLAVYDITGRKVRDLVSGSLIAGDHSVSWNGLDDSGRQVSSGVYFARLSFGKCSATRKMLFMK
jgi:ligand-binding sensor domain-containing protein